MNSIQTKSKNFFLVNGKAIAGVVFIPKNVGFKVYVAWEWENQAEKGIFAITESNYLIANSFISPEMITNIADYGTDVTHDPTAKKYFPNLF